MFPFKVKEFTFQTRLNNEQLKERLAIQIRTTKTFAGSTSQRLHDTISNNKGIVEVKDSSYRNSFRPVVVFKWSSSIKGL